MGEIKLEKRVKYAGDVHEALLEAGFTPKGASELLNHVPDANVAPVVRCEDCKHSRLPSALTQKYGKPGTLTCCYGPCNKRNVSSDDFCSYGEKK